MSPTPIQRPTAAKAILYFGIVAAWLVLMAAALTLLDPYVYPVRSLAPALLAAVGSAGAATAWLWGRGAWRGRVGVAMGCAIPIAVAVSLGAQEARLARVMAAPADRARELGAHFIVGYSDLSEVAELAKRGLIGGIFVTARNAAHRDATRIRAEIAGLQDKRRAAGLPPLIVASDQEGGLVSRLSPPLPAFPALSSLTRLPGDQREPAALDEGLSMGRALGDLGVTLDLAPVVDLGRERPDDPLDFNSHIARRAISADPEMVIPIARGFVEGLARAGVAASLKHFPGLGRVAADTHHFRAGIKASLDELAISDWKPFREIGATTDALLMIGHASVDSVDPDHAASESKALVDGIIRRAWGHQGALITDDMGMGAVFHHGICQGVVDSLNAGVDLVLVAYDERQYYRLMDCVLAADREGRLDAQKLAQSQTRLAAMLNRQRTSFSSSHGLAEH